MTACIWPFRSVFFFLFHLWCLKNVTGVKYIRFCPYLKYFTTVSFLCVNRTFHSNCHTHFWWSKLISPIIFMCLFNQLFTLRFLSNTCLSPLLISIQNRNKHIKYLNNTEKSPKKKRRKYFYSIRLHELNHFFFVSFMWTFISSISD